MEDRRNSTERTNRLRSYFTKRRRIEDVADYYGVNDDNNETCPYHRYDCPGTHSNRPYNPPELNDSYGTHYYGDDCPGGHLADTAPFDVAAFLQYLDYIDNHELCPCADCNHAGDFGLAYFDVPYHYE